MNSSDGLKLVSTLLLLFVLMGRDLLCLEVIEVSARETLCLYIITPNILSLLLHWAIDNGKISPFKIKNKCMISHFMYTYDIMLCFKANKKSCSNIRRVLDRYYNIIGKKVNASKSRVYLPKNCSISTKCRISNLLGIS